MYTRYTEKQKDHISKIQIQKIDRLKPPTATPQQDYSKTVINLSTHNIHAPAISALAKGQNFAITPTRIPVEDIITRVEATIQLLPNTTAEDIRSETTPRIYGLPKIHKTGVPLRPIVSAINSPTHNLAKFLAKKLTPLTGQTKHHIKNSQHFVQAISEINLTDNDLLVSFDVESLFTNVPIYDTLNLLEPHFDQDTLALFKICLFVFFEVKEIVSLGKSMGLEVDEGDIHKLVEEHGEELSTDELKELHMMQHTEVLQEISCEVEPEEVVSTREIKDMLAMWEKLSSFIEKKHTEKVSTGRASVLFSDTCLTRFRNILKSRQTQITLDRFLLKRPASDSAESAAKKGKKR
ncbi:UNVERIFIED_CONTAM: hypothetical protein PYX00_006990 [Menopon gallinae]|uniref:Reverse transcriptase domain-containing protein n=1 Tax=Menopon gallinae TaxID=328185 RepID=A0AAW2HI29_9NEOP